jgi:molybdenum cofactor synthesis domain-containing protein
MEVALITVGDELLSGDTVNTNANWLAARLAERGVAVTRILSVPDDRETIAEQVATYGDAFDRVIVTGGIGGTPDDVTVEAVADAFDRDLDVSELARADVEERLAEIATRIPDRDLDVDVDREAAIPEGSRPLLNGAGLAPGCVLENVYVLPGIPEELKAMFESVADEFAGERRSRFLYTVEPEANIVPALEEAMERYEITVGCYPDREAGHNRLKLVGTDDGELAAGSDWLLEAINVSETPVSRDWNGDDDTNERANDADERANDTNERANNGSNRSTSD